MGVLGCEISGGRIIQRKCRDPTVSCHRTHQRSQHESELDLAVTSYHMVMCTDLSTSTSDLANITSPLSLLWPAA